MTHIETLDPRRCFRQAERFLQRFQQLYPGLAGDVQRQTMTRVVGGQFKPIARAPRTR